MYKPNYVHNPVFNEANGHYVFTLAYFSLLWYLLEYHSTLSEEEKKDYKDVCNLATTFRPLYKLVITRSKPGNALDTFDKARLEFDLERPHGSLLEAIERTMDGLSGDLTALKGLLKNIDEKMVNRGFDAVEPATFKRVLILGENLNDKDFVNFKNIVQVRQF